MKNAKINLNLKAKQKVFVHAWLYDCPESHWHKSPVHIMIE